MCKEKATLAQIVSTLIVDPKKMEKRGVWVESFVGSKPTSKITMWVA